MFIKYSELRSLAKKEDEFMSQNSDGFSVVYMNKSTIGFYFIGNHYVYRDLIDYEHLLHDDLGDDEIIVEVGFSDMLTKAKENQNLFFDKDSSHKELVLMDTDSVAEIYCSNITPRSNFNNAKDILDKIDLKINGKTSVISVDYAIKMFKVLKNNGSKEAHLSITESGGLFLEDISKLIQCEHKTESLIAGRVIPTDKQIKNRRYL